MPKPQPLILLPPSEGKTVDGDGPAWAAGSMADPALDRHRRVVVRAVTASGALKRRAPTRPAIDRYSGVLYRELDWPSLPAAARCRGDVEVRIVSGLWGLVAPPDPIPHYRLKMSDRVGDLGRLASWWKPRLAPTLADRTAGAIVWDLLPIEHSAAIDWSACASRRRVTFRFLDGEGRTVSHWNKLLKGSLVRWLLTEQPDDPEDLANFSHPLRYALDRAASDLSGPLANVVMRART